MKKIFLSILVLISFAAFSQKKHYGLYQFDSLYSNLTQQGIDTTNFKIVVQRVSDGKHFKMYWPAFSANALVQGSQNLSQNTSINLTGTYSFTFGNATKFGVDLTSNGSDATGDLFYRGSDGYFKRIAMGTTKQALHPDGSGGYVWRDTTAATIQLLSSQYSDASNVSTSETDLLSYTIPGGTLANNGDKIVIEGVFTTPSNANNKDIKFYFGGYSSEYTPSTIPVGATIHFTISIIRTGASTQRIVEDFVASAGTLKSNYFTGSETLSGSIVTKFAGTGVSSNDITQRIMTVTYYKAP